MNWPKAIVHIDMDTFFVSVERLHDPSLVGKPVIVGGGPGGEQRRGVVAACSYETRKFGVHSAMPLARALRLCPDAILVPVGRSRYGDYTRQVREALEGFTDLVEMTSPDEAYIDLRGTERLHGPPIEAAHRIRNKIASEVGLPVSVGLATSTTFAKIASKLSKPSGMFVVFPGQEPSIARPLKLRALPGLGPKTADRLHKHGIRTLGELIDFGEARITAMVGDHGGDLVRRASGEGRGKVQPSRERIQISTERTFGEDLGDVDEILALIAKMTMNLGAQVRKRELWAGTLNLKLRYPDFSTLTRQVPLRPPTNDDRELHRAARELFHSAWDHETPLRLLGVGLTNLTDFFQEELFSGIEEEKGKNLMRAMDAVREKAGKEKLVWGATLGFEKTGRAHVPE